MGRRSPLLGEQSAHSHKHLHVRLRSSIHTSEFGREACMLATTTSGETRGSRRTSNLLGSSSTLSTGDHSGGELPGVAARSEPARLVRTHRGRCWCGVLTQPRACRLSAPAPRTPSKLAACGCSACRTARYDVAGAPGRVCGAAVAHGGALLLTTHCSGAGAGAAALDRRADPSPFPARRRRTHALPARRHRLAARPRCRPLSASPTGLPPNPPPIPLRAPSSSSGNGGGGAASRAAGALARPRL